MNKELKKYFNRSGLNKLLVALLCYLKLSLRMPQSSRFL